MPPVDDEFGELEDNDGISQEAEDDLEDGQTDDEGSEGGEGESEDGDQTSEDGESDDGDEDSLEAEPDEDEEEYTPVRQRQPHDRRRSANRFREERQRREAAERRAQELENEKRALEQRQQNERALQQQRLNEEEQARLADMTPEERTEYRLNKMQATIQYNAQMEQFRSFDSADKANFDAMCRVSAVHRRHRARVEEALDLLRKQGQNMPRETLLVYAVGEAAMKASKEQKQRVAPRPSRKVPRNPSSSRADVARTQSNRKPSSERDRILRQWGDTPL